MRLPKRFKQNTLLTRLAAALVVAMGATLVAWGLAKAPGTSVAVDKLQWLFYDSFYRLRPETDRKGGDVVIIMQDQKSLDFAEREAGEVWPWKRRFWGEMAAYVADAGARAVVFDIVFEEGSPYQDDPDFAERVEAIAQPVVFAAKINPDGTPGKFAVPTDKKIFGAMNVGDDPMFRIYPATVHGADSLALAAVRAGVYPVRSDMTAHPFLLHYHGPNLRSDGEFTFLTLSAVNVLAATGKVDGLDPTQSKINPAMFKDKVVIFGANTVGTYDLKSSPLSPKYPGVEVQATAIDNLIHGQYVRPVSQPMTLLAALIAAMLAGTGVMLPRRVSLKTIGAILALVALVATGIVLFQGETIRWLPLATPLIALLLSTLGAFAYSYMTEDRARKLVLKALSQYLSPEVAAEIAKKPEGLSLGGERREMTVLFTDIAGFTDVSETLTSEQLTVMINFYLDEMTRILFKERATVDKFIGDAIMSFWNAPLSQADHAERACRSALLMAQREIEILPELAKLGAGGIHTRLGINTGFMTVGNMGSTQKFNYTVMGDPVNLGSRLEGANKMYGSTIMLSQTTADLVKGKFLLRQLDLLRVKGKLKPIAVYELLAIGEGAPELQERKRAYDQAYQMYRDQRWNDGEGVLLHLLVKYPKDEPAAALLKRVEKMRHETLPLEWDGVYVAKEK